MTPLIKVLVIAMMLGGAIIAMVGALAAVLWRKNGLASKDLLWAGSAVAAHPERYVRPERIMTVRLVILAGLTLFLLGAILAMIQAMQQFKS